MLLDEATRMALRKEFGYVPDDRGGEVWCVYQNRALIVLHPERRPRIYGRSSSGVPYEFEPSFP